MSTGEEDSVTKGCSAVFLLEIINQIMFISLWMSVLSDLDSCLQVKAELFFIQRNEEEVFHRPIDV